MDFNNLPISKRDDEDAENIRDRNMDRLKLLN